MIETDFAIYDNEATMADQDDEYDPRDDSQWLEFIPKLKAELDDIEVTDADLARMRAWWCELRDRVDSAKSYITYRLCAQCFN